MTPPGLPRHLAHHTWQVAAVLLDLDGVLLDTEVVRTSAWRWWARRHDLDVDRVLAETWGRRLRDAVSVVAPHLDAEVEAAALGDRERTLLRTARRVRGAGGLLRSLPPDRWAIVSSHAGDDLAARLRRARVTAPTVVVDATSTADGRPDPSPVQAAIERLGTEPAATLAVEGSPSGVAAARRAGVHVLAVGPTALAVALGGDTDVPVLGHLGGVGVGPSADGWTVTAAGETAVN